MYIKYDELKQLIQNGDERVKNYFDTFGFVVIKNVLDKKEFKKFLREYDSQYEIRRNEYTILAMLKNRLGFSGPKKFGFKYIYKIWKERSGMAFLPGFLEESDEFVKLFLSQKMQGIFEYFCGKNWLYLGSDGSKFLTTSFPWHRDWFTKMPIMKCNFYFNPLPFFGGKFLLIPGSNFESDTYTQMIQKAMSWPMQNKTPSGLNENSQLPTIRNPRDLLSWRSLFSKRQDFDVPHVALKLGKGDLVVFDHRALHCVQSNYPRFQRRLLTFLIGKNAYDFKDGHYSLAKHSREELMVDLIDLVVNERNHIGCPPWGEVLLQTDFVKSNHFIDIQKTEGSEKWNVGTITLDNGTKFESILDFESYAKIGNQYKNHFNKKNQHIDAIQDVGSQVFSYQDVHLGINSQNIKDVIHD